MVDIWAVSGPGRLQSNRGAARADLWINMAAFPVEMALRRQVMESRLTYDGARR